VSGIDGGRRVGPTRGVEPAPRVEPRAPSPSPGPAPSGGRGEHPALALQRHIGNRAVVQALRDDVPLVRRALATATPADRPGLNGALAGNPKAISQFNHAEIVTDAVGTESDTSAFTHSGASALLENQLITLGGTRIGMLRPLVKRKDNSDPGVKMHLVNSFFHPDANSWGTNWVWGHHDLNGRHENQIEDVVKHHHPKSPSQTVTTLSSGEAIEAIAFRTDVTAKSSVGGATADLLVDDIVRTINIRAPYGFAGIPRSSVSGAAQIGGKLIDVYFAAWQAAAAATVASAISGDLRLYGVNSAGEAVAHDVALPAVADPDPVQYTVVIEKEAQWFADNGYFTVVEAGRSKRARKGPDTAVKDAGKGKKGGAV
jgi:hypothetical protein